jgi:hypothetical protein
VQKDEKVPDLLQSKLCSEMYLHHYVALYWFQMKTSSGLKRLMWATLTESCLLPFTMPL